MQRTHVRKKHVTQPQATEAEVESLERPPGSISLQFLEVKLKLRAETFSKSHRVVLRVCRRHLSKSISLY